MKRFASLVMLVLASGCVTTEPPQSETVPSKPIWQDRLIIPPSEVQALHRELDAAPEKRNKVADSLIPLRDGKGRITAYIVHIESAPEAFARFGIQNGDIIYRINHMPMTEAKRWQYIVDEVVAGRINVLFIEIERGGKPYLLIHEFRESNRLGADSFMCNFVPAPASQEKNRSSVPQGRGSAGK